MESPAQDYCGQAQLGAVTPQGQEKVLQAKKKLKINKQLTPSKASPLLLLLPGPRAQLLIQVFYASLATLNFANNTKDRQKKDKKTKKRTKKNP